MKNCALGVKGDEVGALFESKMVALTRLIEAAQAVDDGAVVVDKHTCEVPLEDMQELRAALREWQK